MVGLFQQNKKSEIPTQIMDKIDITSIAKANAIRKLPLPYMVKIQVFYKFLSEKEPDLLRHTYLLWDDSGIAHYEQLTNKITDKIRVCIPMDQLYFFFKDRLQLENAEGKDPEGKPLIDKRVFDKMPKSQMKWIEQFRNQLKTEQTKKKEVTEAKPVKKPDPQNDILPVKKMFPNQEFAQYVNENHPNLPIPQVNKGITQKSAFPLLVRNTDESMLLTQKELLGLIEFGQKDNYKI